ncbi:1,4-dihydroxy-2-naphthoate polyprenyltransferase [Lacticigenium naphthae]|uniref:1,4-dihydroxy-2-naphthoate polyprenyltransferase n=1 Tax=Lacticigenium naphthae TaxID=515351 RepID=UPI0004242B1A|nr:1,4-dihydroxy-2-naphthoate polyprenyltransferase [Lacticigenium naphthae]
MTLKIFLRLVEIQTKIASLIPFLLGILFSLYYFNQIDWTNTVLFFIAMLVFDMTTTAINNLMDYQKAKDKKYKQEVNVIGQSGLAEKTVIQLILGMLVVSTLIGLVLVLRTNFLLLLMGGVAFFIGIFYTFGPIPISRTPLGEILSGLTMGFGIFFITLFVNDVNNILIQLQFDHPEFLLSGNYIEILSTFLVSLPTVFLIANIMLANNTCDLEQDITNHRFTLPFYIGKKQAVILFNILMYSSYGVILLAVLLRLLHPILLGTFLTLPLIKRNLDQFNKRQVKEETFVVAIKNTVLFSVVEIVLLGLSLFFV